MLTLALWLAQSHELRESKDKQQRVVLERPRRLFVEACPARTGSLVVNRDVLGRVGSFDETLRYAEDVELWTRLPAHCRFAFSSRVTMQYRQNPKSLVSTADEGKVDLALAEVYSRLLRHQDFRDMSGELRRAAAQNYFSVAHALRRKGTREAAARYAWRGLMMNPLSTGGYRELIALLAAGGYPGLYVFLCSRIH